MTDKDARRVPMKCATCGTHEISLHLTCHNSACVAYADEITVHEGWRHAALQAMERERDEAQKILRMMFTSGEVDVAKVALKAEARVAELNHFAQGQVELVAIVAGERDKLRELLRRKWEDDSTDIRPSTIDAALQQGKPTTPNPGKSHAPEE